MKKYFILNFLSFESLNMLHIFLPIKNLCSVHGVYTLEGIERSNLNAGYPVSCVYKKLHEIYPDATFILIKESPDSVIKHLLFGYYNQLYNEKILKDFKNFYNVDLANLNTEKFIETINKYYEEVTAFIGDKLITVDLSKYEDSFITFVNSVNFLAFCEELNDGQGGTNMQQKGMKFQQSFMHNPSNFIKDFFIKSKFYGLPESYSLGTMMGNSFNRPLAGETQNQTYLELFTNELNNHTIIESIEQ